MNWPPLRRADDDPRRRRFRKGIYLLPSLFTTLNMALGYYALYHAIQGSAAEPWHYDNAAKAIGFAIIFDGLDGKIARMTNTESDFRPRVRLSGRRHHLWRRARHPRLDVGIPHSRPAQRPAMSWREWCNWAQFRRSHS